MRKVYLWRVAVISIAIVVTSCEQLASNETLLDVAANLVINKYQSASCEEIAQMKPQSGKSSQASGGKDAALQAQAIEMLRKNPEMRKKFIDRVAGPIANRMFECNLIP
ncbi:MAG: hypothetical protein MUE44_24060 [Oscillatoriaceae cyanobacterium Prado104]|jgi:hypothetical protein|nr:hypothetical protein [Oscillatoriaceae cyanobacterium Prado104]